MSKNPVIVNNPFFEETDDKFRKIFFGDKDNADNDKGSVEEHNETTIQKNQVEINTPKNTHKKDISKDEDHSTSQQETESSFAPKPVVKRLERHNFKLYNTQIRRLQEVARKLKDHRGDDVKADMSGILRYLIDTLDDEQILVDYPSRP